MSLMKEMIHNGVHFGHQKKYWNPKMSNFIFGINHGIHIINLEKTIPLLLNAQNFIKKIIKNNGQILFVGTKKVAQHIILEEATFCNMPYVNLRWLGGMLTNYKTIRKSIKKLNKLKDIEKNNQLQQRSKKESLLLKKEIDKLDRSLGGIVGMNGLPSALIVVDTNKENIAIKEAHKLGIPIIAIVDTNSSFDNVDYIIPGNDDSMKSIKCILSIFSHLIKDNSNIEKEEKNN